MAVNELIEIGVGREVVNNFFIILENLDKSIINKIAPENISVSKTGTIVIELGKNEHDIFSIEIGKSSFGYFSDVNNETKHYAGELKMSDQHVREMINDLCDFLFNG